MFCSDDSAQRRHEVEHGLVGERAEDELAFAAGGDDPGPPHLLQVLRRVGDREAGSLRQDLDTPLALGQLLQEFEPMRVRQRFGDGRELGEQRHGTEVLRRSGNLAASPPCSYCEKMPP